MNKIEKIDRAYRQWLINLKTKIRQSQIKAAVRVNEEMLRLYWDLGKDIVTRQMESTWGSGFFEKLSKDLRSEFPDMQGFSTTNLKYIKRFFLFYAQDGAIRHQIGDEIRYILGNESQKVNNKRDTIRPQVVDKLAIHPIFQTPWGHHREIIAKCKSIHEALFYVQKTIENGWSRAVLMNFMDAGLYLAQGKALNNFDRFIAGTPKTTKCVVNLTTRP